VFYANIGRKLRREFVAQSQTHVNIGQAASFPMLRH
jgi:hypothetical protein